jgi:superfamily II DNA or RNA helicase
MTAMTYGKYAFFGDPNDSAYTTMRDAIEKTYHLEGKTLIFVPLIEAVELVVEKLKKDYPDKRTYPYHSKVPKDEKDDAIRKGDIIVSTIKSCGTGRDIPGLRVVICAEPIASKVGIEQVIGRLRPYAEGKFTYYFDLMDISIPSIMWWFRSRIRKIETLVKQMYTLSIE